MTFEITGNLHMKFEVQQISETFKKREFVLEVLDGAYSQFIKFELTQDKVDRLGDAKNGDEISVSFNLRGREYTKDGETRYFNTLQAWQIAHGMKAEAAPTVATAENKDDLDF
jgi:hypothetical protein